MPGGQHLGHPGGDLDAEGLHAGDPVGHADGVPGPERAQLVAEAPLDGVVDLDQGVGDLRHPAGGVGQRRQQGVAQVAGPAVLLGLAEQEPQAVAQVVVVAGGADDRQVRPGRRPVLQGVQVEDVEHGLAVAPAAAVEAAAGLVAEPARLQHPPQRLGGTEDVAALVGGGELVQVAGHADHDVQPDLVEQPEGGRLGPAHQRPGEGVDLLDRVAVLQGVADVVHAGEAAQAVGDEVGGVLGHHRALAQHPLHERPHALQHLGVGVGGGDELDQLEVAGRVEEVGAEEPAPEVLRAALGHGGQRQPGGVGADHRVQGGHLLDPGQQFLLGLQALHDGLDHPVGVGDPVEVLLEGPQADALGQPGAGQGGRAGGQHALEPALHRLGVEVQQVDRQAGVGGVRGDGGPHGAGAEHGDGTDVVGQGHTPPGDRPFRGYPRSGAHPAEGSLLPPRPPKSACVMVPLIADLRLRPFRDGSGSQR